MAPKTDRMHLVVFGMQNRTFGPYLAANNRILILVMAVHALMHPNPFIDTTNSKPQDPKLQNPNPQTRNPNPQTKNLNLKTLKMMLRADPARGNFLLEAKMAAHRPSSPALGIH
jgi:hypothetical protein